MMVTDDEARVELRQDIFQLKSWPGSILNISVPYPHKILIDAVHFGANNHFPFIEISETPKSYTLVTAGVLRNSWTFSNR